MVDLLIVKNKGECVVVVFSGVKKDFGVYSCLDIYGGVVFVEMMIIDCKCNG